MVEMEGRQVDRLQAADEAVECKKEEAVADKLAAVDRQEAVLGSAGIAVVVAYGILVEPGTGKRLVAHAGLE